MNRLPQSVEVIWFQSRPRIDFKLTDATRGTVSFKADEPGDLLRKLATGYANLLAAHEQLRTENKALRERKS